jgi:hypothetical protein
LFVCPNTFLRDCIRFRINAGEGAKDLLQYANPLPPPSGGLLQYADYLPQSSGNLLQ